MTNANLEETKNLTKIPVVKRVSIPDTLRLIPVGQTARFTVRDMYLGSVRAMVSNLNKRAGRKEFEITVYNNGEIFDVRHNK